MCITTLYSTRTALIFVSFWLAVIPRASLHAEESVKDGDREHWAFRRLVVSPVPVARRIDRARTPVDAFLLAKLESKGLTFAKDADRVTLLRRGFFQSFLFAPTPPAAEACIAEAPPAEHHDLLQLPLPA